MRFRRFLSMLTLQSPFCDDQAVRPEAAASPSREAHGVRCPEAPLSGGDTCISLPVECQTSLNSRFLRDNRRSYISEADPPLGVGLGEIGSERPQGSTVPLTRRGSFLPWPPLLGHALETARRRVGAREWRQRNTAAGAGSTSAIFLSLMSLARLQAMGWIDSFISLRCANRSCKRRLLPSGRTGSWALMPSSTVARMRRNRGG